MTEPSWPTLDTIKALLDSMPGPACAHCDADAELVEVAPNFMVLEIRHDPGCPELARHLGDPP
jgi:hypothetical protein